MTLADDITAVRETLGESIPVGGTEVDTMFTDNQVTAWVNGSSSLDAASLRGWKAKAANLSNLVNVTDGAASRELSDAFDHALEMIKLYTKTATGGATVGRTRVGKIVRS
jgi:hypothetical protein